MSLSLRFESARFYTKIEYSLIFLFFSWLIWNIFFGERIPVDSNTGYDGAAYAGTALDFYNIVFRDHVSVYALTRIFPSAVIAFFLWSFDSHYTFAQMHIVFSVYNTLILSVAVLAWGAIANKLEWSPQVRLISFAGLFLNFAILKMNTYYPILTDTTALVIGLLMVYFYIKESKLCFLATLIAGAFTFPTMLLVGSLLFIFMGKSQPVVNNNDIQKKWPWLWLLFLMLNTIIFVGLIFYTFNVVNMPNVALGRSDSHRILFLTLLGLFCYFMLALYPIWYRDPFFYLRLLKQALNGKVVIVALIACCVKIFITLANNGAPGPLTTLLFAQVIAIRSLAYPLIFLISHVMYYGPILCLCVYYWNEIILCFKNQHTGFFVVTLIYIVLAINQESRQIINYLPILVVGVGQILNRKKINWNFTAWFIFLSLAVSKFWLPLNHGEWPNLNNNPPKVTLEFPMQWYFMNQGPWMSNSMYCLNFVIVSFIFFFIYKLISCDIHSKLEGQV